MSDDRASSHLLQLDNYVWVISLSRIPTLPRSYSLCACHAMSPTAVSRPTCVSQGALLSEAHINQAAVNCERGSNGHHCSCTRNGREQCLCVFCVGVWERGRDTGRHFITFVLIGKYCASSSPKSMALWAEFTSAQPSSLWPWTRNLIPLHPSSFFLLSSPLLFSSDFSSLLSAVLQQREVLECCSVCVCVCVCVY